MKFTKRFVSLVLVVCLVLTIAPMALAAMSFTDVTTADWFYDAVAYVNDKGMMSGDGTSFDPNGTTTRGMIVTVLHRLDGTPAATGTEFADVEAGAWYADAVAWASANSIVNGKGNGLFAPNDPVSREQLASILFRYAQYKGYDVSVGESTNLLSYDDALDVSDYAFSALQWACGAGLINGIGTALVPQGNATRCQVAAILMRFCQNVAGEVEEEEEEDKKEEEKPQEKPQEKPEDDELTDDDLEDLLPGGPSVGGSGSSTDPEEHNPIWELPEVPK